MLWARYSSGSSGSAPCAFSAIELGVLLLEGVGDVLEEDQAEDDVLVLGGVHAAAQRVGHLPELGFVADVGSGGAPWFRVFFALANGYLTKSLCCRDAPGV